MTCLFKQGFTEGQEITLVFSTPIECAICGYPIELTKGEGVFMGHYIGTMGTAVDLFEFDRAFTCPSCLTQKTMVELVHDEDLEEIRGKLLFSGETT